MFNGILDGQSLKDLIDTISDLIDTMNDQFDVKCSY